MLDQIPLKIDREGIKEREDDEKGWGGGGGDDYTRGAIIFNISTKRGQLFEGGDLSTNGYYSRIYGTSAMIIQKKFRS